MHLVSVRSIAASILAIVLAAPGATSAQQALDLSLRGEGYVGYSTIDIETGFGDADGDGVDGGGAGSLSLLVDWLYLQGDVFSDASHFDNLDPERVGGAGHLGWRDSALGSVGVVGAINHVHENDSSTDEWRAGMEGRAFLGSLTAGLDAGYFDGNASSNANANELVYLMGRLAYYVSDRARLDFKGGALGVGKDDTAALLGASAELLVLDHISVFARWEASLLDAGSTEVDEHSVVGGLRLYWAGDQPSLKAYDRERFNESCLGIRDFGRSC